jgi:hypothetical protein
LGLPPQKESQSFIAIPPELTLDIKLGTTGTPVPTIELKGIGSKPIKGYK